MRGPSLADDMSQYLRDAIAATPNVEVRLSTEVADGGGAGRLEWLELRDNATGDTEPGRRRGAVRPDRRAAAH